MNKFYTFLHEKIKENYLLIENSAVLVRELEFTVYPPDTPKNDDFELVLFFDRSGNTVTVLYYYLAKKNIELSNWLAYHKIKYTDNGDNLTIYLSFDDEHPENSKILTVERANLEDNLQVLLKMLENIVPVGELDMLLDRGVHVFAKKGKMEEYSTLKRELGQR